MPDFNNLAWAEGWPLVSYRPVVRHSPTPGSKPTATRGLSTEGTTLAVMPDI